MPRQKRDSPNMISVINLGQSEFNSVIQLFALQPCTRNFFCLLDIQHRITPHLGYRRCTIAPHNKMRLLLTTTTSSTSSFLISKLLYPCFKTYSKQEVIHYGADYIVWCTQMLYLQLNLQYKLSAARPSEAWPCVLHLESCVLRLKSLT